LLYFGFALGDDLLCTAVLRELRNRGHDRILMVSDHRDLFVGNQDFTYLRPLWNRYYRDGSTVAICRRFVRIWGGRFIRPEYAPPSGKDRRRPPSRHVIAEMCAKVGITGPASIRPYLNLSDGEKASASWARDCIVIQSSGLNARHPARLKEWYPARFQHVIEALQKEFSFVQLGSREDPPLQNTRDLRGSTSLRESAAILHQARLYIGLEGFLMHLARAVECPAVIVFGGRSAPWQLGYVCNINIHSTISCAPCWRSNNCELERQCMNDISVADVVAATREMMRRPRNPLAVETVTIASDDHHAPVAARARMSG
ncbi:MAG TPA: glycosyltransferase family 9 protein, partial [Bryobacteraceae bacterium]|nr:glycosyltransferase family 9 protein [Bryobacteraceae bacterium]